MDTLCASLKQLVESSKTPEWLESLKSEMTVAEKYLRSLPTREDFTKYLQPLTKISLTTSSLPSADTIATAVAGHDQIASVLNRAQHLGAYTSPEAIKALRGVLTILSGMPPEGEMLRFLEKLRKVPEMEQTILNLGERAKEMESRLKAEASEVDKLAMKQITDTLDLTKALGKKIDSIPAFPTTENIVTALEGVGRWKSLVELLNATLGSTKSANDALSKLEESMKSMTLNEQDLANALKTLPNIEGVKNAITQTMGDIALSPQQLDNLAKQVAGSLATSTDWKADFVAKLAEMMKDVPSRGPEGRRDSPRPGSSLSGPGRCGDDTMMISTTDFWNGFAQTVNVVGPDAAVNEFITFKARLPTKEEFAGSEYDSRIYSVIAAVTLLFEAHLKMPPTEEGLGKYLKSTTYKQAVGEFVAYSKCSPAIADQFNNTAVMAPNTICLLLQFLSNHLGMHIQMGMLEFNVASIDAEEDYVSCNLVAPLMRAMPQATAWFTRQVINNKPSATWAAFRYKTFDRRGPSVEEVNKRVHMGSPRSLTSSQNPSSCWNRWNIDSESSYIALQSASQSASPPRRQPAATPSDAITAGKKRGIMSTAKTAIGNAGRSISGGSRSLSGLVKVPGSANHSHGRGEVIKIMDPNFDSTKIPIPLRHVFSPGPVQKGVLAINASRNANGLTCCLQTEIDGTPPQEWRYKDGPCDVCRLHSNTVCVVMIDPTTALIKGASPAAPTILLNATNASVSRHRTGQDTTASWAAALRDQHHGQLIDISRPGEADVAALKEQGLDADSIKYLLARTTEGQTKLRTGIANLRAGVQKCLATTALGSRKGTFIDAWPDAYDRCGECMAKSRQCVMILDERTALIKGERV